MIFACTVKFREGSLTALISIPTVASPVAPHGHAAAAGPGEVQHGGGHEVGGALGHEHAVVDGVGAEHQEEVGQLRHADALVRLGAPPPHLLQ